MHIKLEGKPVQEFIIEDDRKFLDVVYSDYKRRVYEKNGAGRVIYFDLVMIAEESLEHEEDRKEVFNESNDFGINTPSRKDFGKKKRPDHKDGPTLGEMSKKNK